MIMKHHALVTLRYFLYGFVCFGGFGLFMQWPHAGISEVSLKLVFYLALAGGGSFIISHISVAILLYLIKDLINGAD